MREAQRLCMSSGRLVASSLFRLATFVSPRLKIEYMPAAWHSTDTDTQSLQFVFNASDI